MFRRRIVYLLCLAGCIAFYIIYRMWLSGIALAAILALPWFSLLVSLPAMVTTSLELSHPLAVTMGEEANADIWVCCNLPAPLARGALEVRRTLTGEKQNNRMNSRLPTHHCGQLELTVRRGRVYDYLGLFRLPVRKRASGKVLIRPVPVPLDTPPDLSRFLIRSWKPKRGGGFGENHELRLYRPGDSLQQIHWKLTAKTGKLILRETVEPERGLMLLKMDLNGTDGELDQKLGQLLWLSRHLLEKDLHHEIRVLTGTGLICHPIRQDTDLSAAMDRLLACSASRSGSIRQQNMSAAWEYYIGGEQDEP